MVIHILQYALQVVKSELVGTIIPLSVECSKQAVVIRNPDMLVSRTPFKASTIDTPKHHIRLREKYPTLVVSQGSYQHVSAT